MRRKGRERGKKGGREEGGRKEEDEGKEGGMEFVGPRITSELIHVPVEQKWISCSYGNEKHITTTTAGPSCQPITHMLSIFQQQLAYKVENRLNTFDRNEGADQATESRAKTQGINCVNRH